MNKAVFLDRDGVVNVERGDYTWKIEDFKLTEGLIGFLKQFKDKNCLFIVITNQGGIGRGLFTHNDVVIAHSYLEDELKKHGIVLTDIYYCPHHPATGKCLCRKPESLMLEKAIARYRIDAEHSVFIGDSSRDIEAGEKAGLLTLKVQPNENLALYAGKVKEMMNLI